MPFFAAFVILLLSLLVGSAVLSITQQEAAATVAAIATVIALLLYQVAIIVANRVHADLRREKMIIDTMEAIINASLRIDNLAKSGRSYLSQADLDARMAASRQALSRLESIIPAMLHAGAAYSLCRSTIDDWRLKATEEAPVKVPLRPTPRVKEQYPEEPQEGDFGDDPNLRVQGH